VFEAVGRKAHVDLGFDATRTPRRSAVSDREVKDKQRLADGREPRDIGRFPFLRSRKWKVSRIGAMPHPINAFM